MRELSELEKKQIPTCHFCKQPMKPRYEQDMGSEIWLDYVCCADWCLVFYPKEKPKQ